MFTCMHVSQFLSECLNENQNQHTTKGFPFIPTKLDGRSPHFLPWTPNFEPVDSCGSMDVRHRGLGFPFMGLNLSGALCGPPHRRPPASRCLFCAYPGCKGISFESALPHSHPKTSLASGINKVFSVLRTTQRAPQRGPRTRIPVERPGFFLFFCFFSENAPTSLFGTNNCALSFSDGNQTRF